MRVRSWIAAGLLLLPAAGHAGEATTYGYDAKGRLIHVVHAGINDNVVASYTFDRADNRTNLTVTDGGSLPPPGVPNAVRVIVVPLGGLTTIGLPDQN